MSGYRSEPAGSETGNAEIALADKYVRANIAALSEVGGNHSQIDARIGAALRRRGLLWEEPRGFWHLTPAGGRVLDLWDAQQAGDDASGDSNLPGQSIWVVRAARLLRQALDEIYSETDPLPSVDAARAALLIGNGDLPASDMDGFPFPDEEGDPVQIERARDDEQSA